jgi:ribosomal protein L22
VPDATKPSSETSAEAAAFLQNMKRGRKPGALGRNSIFGSSSEGLSAGSVSAQNEKPSLFPTYRKRKALNMALVLDPNPRQRENWQRSQIVQMVRNDWKISKETHLRRTERQCMEKSLDLKTSRKKLGKIARQLVGKTVDEALLQLRFSKKRIASEVAKHLEHTRNIAIAKWGMGLGKAEQRTGEAIKIQLKDKTRRLVTDRTELYISQAFINKAGVDLEQSPRARGKMDILRKPWMCTLPILKWSFANYLMQQ